MSESLHTPHWYRIATLRPALRAHLRVVRHEYRGEPWYVIHDPASGRHWRFSAAAQRIIGLMDGQRTVEEIWTRAGQGVPDMPTQGEMLRLLSRLHAAEALLIDATPDVDELLRRQQQRRAADRFSRYGNPLALRMRLFDPDALLARGLRFVRPLHSTVGLLAWAAVVAAGLAIAAFHHEELGRNLSDLLLAPGSLAVTLLVYPLVKLVHELAHGFAVKLRGGEVRETGILWMLLVPVPYVDASASAAFPDKRARMAVSAAGVLAEAFLAGLAMIVWAMVEPGAVRATAWSFALVAGFSTLFFNGNPLLRYDGYYWFADLIEIPNLAGRAREHLASLVRGHVLGLPDARRVSESASERRWLLAYALASAAWRWIVLLAIVALVATWSKWLALLVAAGYVGLQTLRPLLRSAAALLADPRAQAAPGRLAGRALLALTAIGGLMLVPWPLATHAEGVVWLPEQGEIRAGTDGELLQFLAEPGSIVRAGAPLAELDDPLAGLRLARAEAEVGAAEARHLAARATDAVEAGVRLAQLTRARTEWDAASDRAEARVLLSPVDGRFVVARPGDAPGRFYRQGDVVGYVVPPTGGTVLAVVDQDEIGLIKEKVTRVQVRLVDSPGIVRAAQLTRLTPAGGFELPSAALGRPAGGSIPVAPDDAEGRRSLARVFRVEVAIDHPGERLGGRAFIRFDHGYEVLVARLWRATRRLFLRQFDA